MTDRPSSLRRGWTTGACAAAAAKAAFAALRGGGFPDPVTITLPGGQQPAFALARSRRGDDYAMAGVIKDAGDDPDVTHGALILATLRPGRPGTGIRFTAGEGVGTVTKPGLPLPVGEAAINPMPRKMIASAIADIAGDGNPPDLTVEIAIPGGEELAARTWNPRLGIVGGLSVLGTTGIVVPFSCSAWIASIHRGVDVARATGCRRIVACTGSTSEAALRRMLDDPPQAWIDMGDFIGGLLKYLRRHPVENLIVAGGFAKICKLAAGHMDLHSARSRVDFAFLAEQARHCGLDKDRCAAIAQANTALEVLNIARERENILARRIAALARERIDTFLEDDAMKNEIYIVSRDGRILAHVP